MYLCLVICMFVISYYCYVFMLVSSLVYCLLLLFDCCSFCFLFVAASPPLHNVHDYIRNSKTVIHILIAVLSLLLYCTHIRFIQCHNIVMLGALLPGSWLVTIFALCIIRIIIISSSSSCYNMMYYII